MTAYVESKFILNKIAERYVYHVVGRWMSLGEST